MTVDMILYDVLCTLYPDVGFETEAVVILAVLAILVIVSFAVACLFAWLDDRKDAPLVAMGTCVLLVIIWIAFYSATLDGKKDRLVRELVNDPAALPVVLEIKEDLEWVKDPRIQRNTGERK